LLLGCSYLIIFSVWSLPTEIWLLDWMKTSVSERKSNWKISLLVPNALLEGFNWPLTGKAQCIIPFSNEVLVVWMVIDQLTIYFFSHWARRTIFGNIVWDPPSESFILVQGHCLHLEPVASVQVVFAFTIRGPQARFESVDLNISNSKVEFGSFQFPRHWTVVHVQLSDLPARVDIEIHSLVPRAIEEIFSDFIIVNSAIWNQAKNEIVLKRNEFKTWNEWWKND
jgi:hypothetical protein